MPEVWPPGLPASPLVEGFEESFADNSIRSSMGQGPDKLRRRSTAAVAPLAVQFNMTGAQVATLKTFYDTTLLSGSLSFEFTHPRTAATVTVRFTSPPKLTKRGPNTWRATFGLEVLP